MVNVPIVATRFPMMSRVEMSAKTVDMFSVSQERTIEREQQMNVKARQRIERSIARRVILDGKAAGFKFNIDNGGDSLELPKSTDKVKLLLDTMFATDDETLFFYKDDKLFGWVYFIYGNDGYDVVSDYTCNLEDVMKGASALANKYA